LFDELKIPPLRKLKTGFSTDADVLEILAVEHELPRLLLLHRKYTKLKSTYVDALPLEADENNCVHTSFNQTITATGRLSSSNPNLQNIPVKTEAGREIRRAFVPRKKENVLVSGDYSQIELRILAHVSGEEMLIEAFRNNEDIHRKTASLIFGTLPALVSDEERRMAKTVNFGIVYGQGAFGLSQQIGVSQKEAKTFIENYFATYPKIKRYMDDTIAYAREHGCVKTLFGRIRALPDIHSGNAQVRNAAERTAINTPIQGAAADLIKIAMVRLHHKIENHEVPAILLLQVHDELVLEAAEKDADAVLRALVHELEHAHAFSVPLKVDARIGKNWLEAHG
jgi:DNA polymerase-1